MAGDAAASLGAETALATSQGTTRLSGGMSSCATPPHTDVFDSPARPPTTARPAHRPQQTWLGHVRLLLTPTDHSKRGWGTCCCCYCS